MLNEKLQFYVGGNIPGEEKSKFSALLGEAIQQSDKLIHVRSVAPGELLKLVTAATRDTTTLCPAVIIWLSKTADGRISPRVFSEQLGASLSVNESENNPGATFFQRIFP